MKVHPLRHALVVLAILSSGLTSVVHAGTQRLHVSFSGRMLVQDDGTPFFWLGDTNWRLYKLTRSDVNAYLDDRRSKQFNVIQGPVLLTRGTQDNFTNAYGETNTDPDNPNEQWFRHIDYIVDAANQRNLHIALTVAWGSDWDVFQSNDSAHDFGVWLGQRYRNRSNVVWIVAGEYAYDGVGSPMDGRWDALGRGLKEGSGFSQLVTVHGSYQSGLQSSSVSFQNASWLDFNMIQSSQSGDSGPGSDNWNLVKTDWKRKPVKPTLDGEANYEQYNGWDAFGVRRRAYWSVFAGGFGHTYGANAVWGSSEAGDPDVDGSPDISWQQALDFPGAYDMKYLRRLIESRPMMNRAKGDKALLSPAGDDSQHIQTTRDKQGRFLMVYVPQRGRSFTVDMSKISGSSARGWWFDPHNGQATKIGTFSASGARSFTTPNSGEDWVLVLDDKSQNYPAPGTGGPLQ